MRSSSKNAWLCISNSCCFDEVALNRPAILISFRTDNVWHVELGSSFGPAIDVRLRLVHPPIPKVTARLAVFERQQQHHGNGGNSPLQYEFDRYAEQFPVEETSQKERQRRDQQDNNEIFV